MAGGGLGNVLSTAGSLAAGQSPMGAFGSALGSQLLSGGGGSGPGAAGSAANPYGIGTRNQTQLVGPNAGVNPATSQFFNNQPRPQVQQPAPQVQPQVLPQVQPPQQIAPPAFSQNYMNELAAAAAANPRPVGGGFGLLGTGMPAQRPLGGGFEGAPGSWEKKMMEAEARARATAGQPDVAMRAGFRPQVLPPPMQNPNLPGFAQPYFRELERTRPQPQVRPIPQFAQPYYRELMERQNQPQPQVQPAQGLGLLGLLGGIK